MNIWQKLQRQPAPILALAPLDGLTNLPMRLITKKYGAPDLMFTEFVNVEGLHHARERLLPILRTQAEEGPVIAQLYGLNPEFFAAAATLVCSLGFAGLDLNMGCPARNVVHHGAGAGLIKNRELAAKIFQATLKASQNYAQEHGGEPLPISIKTRLGYANANEMDEWLKFLLDLQPTAISLHGRTLRQQYTGTADWEKIAHAVELARGSTTLILGNGDIKSRREALTRTQASGVAGVLIGRGALGNPFVFKERATNHQHLAQIALEHCQLYEKLAMNAESPNFLPMRTHLAHYLKGFPHAAELRSDLMQSNSSREVAKILTSFFDQNHQF